MCNAWNHPQNCTCGWGGEGHSGSSTFSDFVPVPQRWWPRSLRNTYDSYDNPNASCPVCGASVFFYQSPNGGRVFFDELGPPWPKHPCTDNSSQPGRIYSAPTVTTERANYAWQRSGWQPFFIKSIIGIDKNFLKITVILHDQRICLYIERLVEHHLHDQVFSEKSLAHIKASTDTSYQLSILLPHGAPITINAFMLLADARNDLIQRINTKKAKTIRGKSSFRTQSSERPKEVSSKPNSVPLRPQANTTMAIAFRKAQDHEDKS